MNAPVSMAMTNPEPNWNVRFQAARVSTKADGQHLITDDLPSAKSSVMIQAVGYNATTVACQVIAKQASSVINLWLLVGEPTIHANSFREW
jgi:hypothetical protein